MAIELIIFDLGNVLFLYDLDIISRKISLLESIPPEKIHQALFTGDLPKLFDRGEITPEEFFGRFKDEAGLKKLTFKDFVPIWEDIFVENKPVSDLLIRLKDKYKVCVLSNTNDLHFNYLRNKFPFMKEVPRFILSFVVGKSKPHPDIYRVALEGTGVESKKAVFLDDLIEFVEGARQVNIQAIQFKNARQAIKDLTALGIDCG
jgi:glucose-1-phosphatase